MNDYFPAGYDDIDKEKFADDVRDLACEMFDTQDPTSEQLNQAAVELENTLEQMEARYL